jgi:protein SCO1/2
MLCTYVLNGLVSSLRVLKFTPGVEFTIVTVSFNHRETHTLAAAKKALYIREYGRAGAASDWHFLTGDEDSIRRLADAVGFQYNYDAKQNQFAHASGIMVLTPEGRLARYFYGVEYPPRDLRLALVEASKNKIGSPVDQFLLFCFHYDPATGKYGPYVLNLVRIGGALTILTIGVLIIGLKRREKRSHV